MKLVIELHDDEPGVGDRYIRTGQQVTVRDVRGRVAWRGVIDGYKKDGRTSSPLMSCPIRGS